MFSLAEISLAVAPALAHAYTFSRLGSTWVSYLLFAMDRTSLMFCLHPSKETVKLRPETGENLIIFVAPRT